MQVSKSAGLWMLKEGLQIANMTTFCLKHKIGFLILRIIFINFSSVQTKFMSIRIKLDLKN